MDFKKLAEDALKISLPKEILFSVKEYSMLGTRFLAIKIYSSEYLINNVSGQHPDIASFSFNLENYSLQPQVFGGNGGQILYRSVDKNNPKEKYNALGSEKIPFRRSKIQNEQDFSKAVKKIGVNYMKTLNKILEIGLHQESEHVAYAKSFYAMKQGLTNYPLMLH